MWIIVGSISETLLARENWSNWGETLSQYHFFHHESHIEWYGIEPGTPGKKPALFI